MDDASTDGTAEVVAALAAADPRIVLVRSPENGGASAARNLGLPHVRGEWLTFLDADDRLLPGAIGALVAAAVLADALAVVGQRIWSNGERTWITKLYDQPDIREPGRKSLRHASRAHVLRVRDRQAVPPLVPRRPPVRGTRARATSRGRSGRCFAPATGSR